MTAALSDDALGRLIGEAQAAYIRCVDDEGAVGWADHFVEDCLYRVTTQDNYRLGLEAGLIHADGRAMLIDRIAALRDANIYEQHSYRHILGPFSILARDGEETAVETGFLVLRIMRTGETSIFATGRYLDRYRLVGDRLLLRERTVVCDSSRIDTLLAIPL